MMAEGWIKLYRKITEWEWYTVPSMAHLFIHLLFLANQKDKRWKGILIKRGRDKPCRADRSRQENGQ